MNDNDNNNGNEEVEERLQLATNNLIIMNNSGETMSPQLELSIQDEDMGRYDNSNNNQDLHRGLPQVQDEDMQEQPQLQQEESNSNPVDSNDHQEAINKERRSSIQHILKNTNLTNIQRRQSIQILMDGRRRSGFGSTFAEAAKNVAAEFASFGGSSASSAASCSGSSCTALPSTLPSDAVNARTSTDSAAASSVSSCNESSNQKMSINFNMNMNMNMNLSGMEFQNFHQHRVAYTLSGEPTGDTKQMELGRPVCNHYNRNCSIISACCGMVFGCRFCHDDCEMQSIPFLKLTSTALTTTSREEQMKKKPKREEEATPTISNVKSVVVVPPPGSGTGTGTGTGSDKEMTPFYCSPVLETTITTVPTTTSSSSSTATKHKKFLSRRLSLNSVLSETGDDVYHEIGRFETEEIICRICYTRQSSKT